MLVGIEMVAPAEVGGRVHGGRAFLGLWAMRHSGIAAPSIELLGLGDDVLVLLAQLSTSAAALLAQCCTELHTLLKGELHDLLRLQEVPSNVIKGLPGRYWIRQPLLGAGGLVHIVGHSARECVVLEGVAHQKQRDASDACVWKRLVTDPMLIMPTAAALHGHWTLIADRATHLVHVLHDGCSLYTLEADAMRNPCGVATDGTRAIVCADGWVHVFDLNTRQCTVTWPAAVAVGGARLECEHGVAIHGNEVFIVDQRGSRVHVFSFEGGHLHSFGGKGTDPGRFRQPWGIASCGPHVLVSECGGRRVQAFTADGRAVGHVALEGCGTLSGLCAGTSKDGLCALVADWDQCCVRELRLLPWYPA